MKKTFIIWGLCVIVFTVVFTSPKYARAEPYGWSPNVDHSWQGTSQRVGPKLEKSPILLQPNHMVLPIKPKKGEVVLFWHKVPGVTGYNIYFGLSPKNYIYSVPDVGDTNHFTIGALANRVYYFAIQAKQGDSVSDLSQEWAVRPGSSGFVSGGTSLAYRPVKRSAPLAQKSKTVVQVLPTKAAVKGVETTKPPVEVRTQPPVEEESVRVQEAPRFNPPTPTPTPKPKSFWQKLLGIFGF